jgi:hypothetical protein
MEYDFVNDRRLGYDEAGVLLHILQNMDQSATAEWLMERTSAGRDRVRRLVASLVQHEFMKIERVVGQPQKVFVRGCLVHEWKLTGAKSNRSRKSKPIELPTEELAMAVVESSIELVECELVEAVAEPALVKISKKKVSLVDRAKADQRFQTLLKAYRQMLKAKKLPGNLGKVDAAAREFSKLYPLIDSGPELFEVMIGGMKAYSQMCGQYPVGLSRYISESLWVTAMEGAEETTIDWEKIDDEIEGGDF